MKKLLLGFIAIVLAGQVSLAQPVSDMAVIPMGITVQSIMRLDITKGGNIEFVISRIEELTTGIPFSTSYETSGTVSASQNWDLTLTTDGAFEHATHADLALNVVDYQFTAAIPANTTASPAAINTPASLASPITLFAADGAGTTNYGSNIPFTIQWRCGNGGSLAGTPAGRYTTNIILSLTAGAI